jgi:hypothetical protein
VKYRDTEESETENTENNGTQMTQIEQIFADFFDFLSEFRLIGFSNCQMEIITDFHWIKTVRRCG